MGSVYRPTSLDYISRPNPLEPQSVPQTHPLDGTPQLPQAPNKDLLRGLYDANAAIAGERPSKRRKSTDGKSMDLPKLPVRQSTKRLRIPPTLSGLHQPPPNAGLLPSISIEQPSGRRDVGEQSNEESASAPAAKETTPPPSAITGNEPGLTKTGKPKRNKWSDEETACLLKGVARFGVGSWTKILNCPDYCFQNRSALDLKDRFRVCCPDDYQRKKRHVLPRGKSADPAAHGSRPSRSDRKSGAELQDLGINKPFAKVQRRSRRSYTATEDEALLKGFTKYGTQWAVIRADEGLGLEHRTSTDLRDRMRTKYPDEYAKAGLAPRPDVFPKPAKRGKEDEPVAVQDDSGKADIQEAPRPAAIMAKPSAPHSAKPTELSRNHTAPSFLFPSDDVFFGLPFDQDDDDMQAERITLDRGILDWPLDPTKPAAYDSSRGMTIDPIATLNLPRPTVQQQTQPISTYSTLPSLAAITAYSDFDESGGQLELPSLVLGQLEPDGRHFLGFSELLS